MLQSRREKNLCYYCDEFYWLGHKYKREFMLLILEPNDSKMNGIDLNNLLHIEDPIPNEPGSTDLSDINSTQSIHGLMGQLMLEL